MYVRLPREQAAALDRLAGETGRRKQQLVSDLLSDRLVVGRAEIREDRTAAAAAEGVEEVLTLEEAAALLRVPAEAIRRLAEAGELPGRRLGPEWRFARAAVLAWLMRTEPVGGAAMPVRSR